MLRELNISNLALIEDASLVFDTGLHCFTGETGAGKSLLIGAIEALLALRPATNMLRNEESEARISGLFELRGELLPRRVAELADCEIEEGQLLITRRIGATGRSSFSLNGQPATAAMVRQIAELVIDVHGQHDHQSLLRPTAQIELLDRYAKCHELQEQFAEIFSELRTLRDRRRELGASQQLRTQQLELYEFQADEIDAVDMVEGEFEEVHGRHKTLANLSRVQADASVAYAAMYDSEDAALTRLQSVVGLLRKLSEMDEALVPIAESVKGASAHVYDAAFELGRYIHKLEIDPAEMADNTDRLNELNRIIHKYGHGGGEAGVLTYRKQIASEIVSLKGESSDLESMDAKIGQLQAKLQDIGADLSKKRHAAAKKLVPLVKQQLAQLGMQHAEFAVDLQSMAVAQAGPRGLDAIEMLVSANPGHPLQPLRKIASGGEMSRIVLAIKSILAEADETPVLVFDEIDANIGGRIGSVVGEKLRKIAAGRQVFCITHLPQIAAYASSHWKIAKEVIDGKTTTIVCQLGGEESRIEELAEMLTGKQPSQTSRQQAMELISASESPRDLDAARPPRKSTAKSGGRRRSAAPKLRLTA